MDYTRVQDAFPVLSMIPRNRLNVNVTTKKRRQKTLPSTNTNPGSPLTSRKIWEERERRGLHAPASGVQVNMNGGGDAAEDEIEEGSVDDQSQSNDGGLLEGFNQLSDIVKAQGNIIAKLQERIDAFETRVSRIDEVRGGVATLEDRVQKLEDGGNVLADLKKTGGALVQETEEKLEKIKYEMETYNDTITTQVHAKVNKNIRDALDGVDESVKNILKEKIQFITDSIQSHDFTKVENESIEGANQDIKDTKRDIDQKVDKFIKEQQARMRTNVSVPIPDIEPDGSVAPSSEHDPPESESGSGLKLTQTVTHHTNELAVISEWKGEAEERFITIGKNIKYITDLIGKIVKSTAPGRASGHGHPTEHGHSHAWGHAPGDEHPTEHGHSHAWPHAPGDEHPTEHGHSHAWGHAPGDEDPMEDGNDDPDGMYQMGVHMPPRVMQRLQNITTASLRSTGSSTRTSVGRTSCHRPSSDPPRCTHLNDAPGARGS
eukprot:762454-Hanusia_phi.AAC.2